MWHLAKLTFFTGKPQLCIVQYIHFKFLQCMYEHCQHNIYTKFHANFEAYLQLCKCPKIPKEGF